MSPDRRDNDDTILVHPDEFSLIEQTGTRQQRVENIARIRLLWRERELIWKATLVGTLCFIIISFLIPVRYESTVRLMPPDQQSGMMGMLSALSGSGSGSASTGGSNDGMGALAGIAGDMLGLKTSSDLFIGILESRTVQDDLIKKFELQKVYWDRRIEDARSDLTRHTDIAADRRSGIITIKINDHSPQRAAAMGLEYVEQLNAILTNLNTSAAHRERVFLEQRLQEVTQSLETAEKKLGQFSSKNVTIDPKEQSIAMVDAAARLEGELVAGQTELQGLKQIYSDNNVRVRAAQARVEELKRQLQKLGGTQGDHASNEDTYVDSLYPTIRQLPLLGVNYADLYREAKVEEATFEMLTRQYELSKVEEAKELPSVKVLDQPDIPGKRSFPPRSLIVFLGIFISLMSGVLFVLSYDRWRTLDGSDPRKVLAIEVWSEVRDRHLLISRKDSSRDN